MPMNPIPPEQQPGQGGSAMQFMAPAAAMIDPMQVQAEAQQQMEGQQQQLQIQQQMTEMAAQLDQAETALEQNKKQIETLKDENRALHHAIEPEDLRGASKRMYDRAGTSISDEQSIPREGMGEKQINDEDMKKLIAEAFSGQSGM